MVLRVLCVGCKMDPQCCLGVGCCVRVSVRGCCVLGVVVLHFSTYSPPGCWRRTGRMAVFCRFSVNFVIYIVIFFYIWEC